MIILVLGIYVRTDNAVGENACNPPTSTVLIKTYGLSDTHAAIPTSTEFTGSVCLSSLDNSGVYCEVRENNCLTGQTCVLSLYQEEDSHIGDCDAYNKKVCCVVCPKNFVWDPRLSSCTPGGGLCYIGDLNGKYISEQCKNKWREPYPLGQNQSYWEDAIKGNPNQDCFKSPSVDINTDACCYNTIYNNKEYGLYDPIIVKTIII